MKKFKISLLVLFAMLFFSACSSDENKQVIKICPECNMELPSSNIHTSTIENDSEKHYFDDVGCMVLWANKQEIDFKDVKTEIFSNDTKKYIDALTAFYSINEKTPMSYGFSAYEKNIESRIGFQEIRMKMLRGEHMANPKIRKQILGY